ERPRPLRRGGYPHFRGACEKRNTRFDHPVPGAKAGGTADDPERRRRGYRSRTYPLVSGAAKRDRRGHGGTAIAWRRHRGARGVRPADRAAPSGDAGSARRLSVGGTGPRGLSRGDPGTAERRKIIASQRLVTA